MQTSGSGQLKGTPILGNAGTGLTQPGTGFVQGTSLGTGTGLLNQATYGSGFDPNTATGTGTNFASGSLPSHTGTGNLLVGTTGTSGVTSKVTGVRGQGTRIFTGNQSTTATTGVGGVGTITFRPIEGRFTKDKDFIGKMDPYVKFKIGWRSGKSSVAKGEGVNPTWTGDAITVKVKNHDFAKIKVKDKDRFRPDDRLGVAKVPLAQVFQQGKVILWVPITKKDVVTGELHLEMEFTPKV